ncbi:hypothetical protein PAPYR_1680 [Paratrimastix pyriformis]|uniref:Right handed beta helix domain-containing protein n=1 Tax=Paratrimastix pyriformis TaxID=342808 RepID=A0ABQ8UU65_9EUKA|nr:hypothetical protein PAPYR_1680 [Paratrimastix pyriformis]
MLASLGVAQREYWVAPNGEQASPCGIDSIHPCGSLCLLPVESVGEDIIIHVSPGTYQHSCNFTLARTSRTLSIIASGGDAIFECSPTDQTAFVKYPGEISPSSLFLEGLHFRNCRSTGTPVSGALSFANGAHVVDLIRLTDCVFEKCETIGASGGAVSLDASDTHGTIDHIEIINSTWRGCNLTIAGTPSGTGAGAGLYVYSPRGNLTISNSLFEDNAISALDMNEARGAGMYAIVSGAGVTGSTWRNNRIDINADAKGAGFYLAASSLELSTSLITNNSIWGVEENSFSSGGGVCLEGPIDGQAPIVPVIRNCTFDGNRIITGPYCRGSALFVSNARDAQVDDCLFTRNGIRHVTNLLGGALTLIAPPGPGFGAILRRTVFRDNQAEAGSGFGGALALFADPGALLDHCQFERNGITSEFDKIVSGGAMLVSSAGNVTLTGCTFHGSTLCARGGMMGGDVLFDSVGGQIHIEDSEFAGASATGDSAISGVSLRFASAARLEIARSRFYNASSESTDCFGGFMYMSAFIPVISIHDCLFQGAKTQQGAVLALYHSDSNRTTLILIERCQFVGNTATYGGAIYLVGGTHNIDETQLRIRQCEFIANRAYDGAALFVFSSRAVLEDCRFDRQLPEHDGTVAGLNMYFQVNNCVFSDTTAGGNGGGFLLSGGAANLTNCTFDSMRADIMGGSIFGSLSRLYATGCHFTQGQAYTGSAVALLKGSGRFENVTVTGQYNEQHGAIFVRGATLTLKNSFFEEAHAECRILSISSTTLVNGASTVRPECRILSISSTTLVNGASTVRPECRILSISSTTLVNGASTVRPECRILSISSTTLVNGASTVRPECRILSISSTTLVNGASTVRPECRILSISSTTLVNGASTVRPECRILSISSTTLVNGASTVRPECRILSISSTTLVNGASTVRPECRILSISSTTLVNGASTVRPECRILSISSTTLVNGASTVRPECRILSISSTTLVNGASTVRPECRILSISSTTLVNGASTVRPECRILSISSTTLVNGASTVRPECRILSISSTTLVNGASTVRPECRILSISSTTLVNGASTVRPECRILSISSTTLVNGASTVRPECRILSISSTTLVNGASTVRPECRILSISSTTLVNGASTVRPECRILSISSTTLVNGASTVRPECRILSISSTTLVNGASTVRPECRILSISSTTLVNGASTVRPECRILSISSTTLVNGASTVRPECRILSISSTTLVNGASTVRPECRILSISSTTLVNGASTVRPECRILSISSTTLVNGASTVRPECRILSISSTTLVNGASTVRPECRILSISSTTLVNGASTVHTGSFLTATAATVFIDGCQFRQGNSYTAGGAIMGNFTNIDISGETALIENNGPWGGAIHVFGGLLSIHPGSRFIDNRADSGGAVCLRASDAVIEGAVFVRNFAGDGGAIFSLDGAFVAVTGSSFEGNRCGARGAAIMVGGPASHEPAWAPTVLRVTRSQFTGHSMRSPHNQILETTGAIYLGAGSVVSESGVDAWLDDLNMTHNSDAAIVLGARSVLYSVNGWFFDNWMPVTSQHFPSSVGQPWQVNIHVMEGATLNASGVEFDGKLDTDPLWIYLDSNVTRAGQAYPEYLGPTGRQTYQPPLQAVLRDSSSVMNTRAAVGMTMLNGSLVVPHTAACRYRMGSRDAAPSSPTTVLDLGNGEIACGFPKWVQEATYKTSQPLGVFWVEVSNDRVHWLFPAAPGGAEAGRYEITFDPLWIYIVTGTLGGVFALGLVTFLGYKASVADSLCISRTPPPHIPRTPPHISARWYRFYKLRKATSIELQSWRATQIASVDFSRLKILERIGNGAAGEVFRGDLDGTPVAVKVCVDPQKPTFVV